MPCATSPLSKALHALRLILGFVLGLGCATAAPVLAQNTDEVALTLPQARQLAAWGLRQNQPELAIKMATGLLKADSKDPFAHYVIAAALGQMNRHGPARKSAARAYRFAQPGPARYRAAQLAARLAYQEGRPTLAQIWLRRTAIHTPGGADETLLARDYQALRRQNPWSFSVRTDLRPSNNVNNGARSAINLIDGEPDGGTLPPSALALSGVIGSVDAALGYRLRADQSSQTQLGLRLFHQRVALSSAARRQTPMASNADFAATYGEISLRHGFRAGPPDSLGSGSIEIALGESRYAGWRNYRLARLEFDRSWLLQENSQIVVGALGEHRYHSRFRSNEANVLGLSAVYSHKLTSGGGITLSLALRDTTAEASNGTYQSASLRGTYTFANMLGPAQISAGLGLGYSRYPMYVASLFIPPTQRDDTSIYGDISFFFKDMDYAGFAPTLRIRAGRRSSNFSQFANRDLSLSLGVQSKF